MTNVVAFDRQKTIENDLTKRIEELEERYLELEQLHSELNKKEDSVAILEKEYNRKVMQYINEIAKENVTLGFLQYATNISLALTENGVSVFVESEEEE